jgi:hypothetical protein
MSGRGGAVTSIPIEEARRQMGAALADALALDQVVVTKRGAEVGWKPARASYFDAVADAWREWRAARDGR